VREFEPALCAAALPDALSRFGDVVPPLLRPSLSGLPAAAAGSILARLASGPRTLLHGSAVAANIFAPRGVLAGAEEGAAAARNVRFVDYADAAAGRGALDVARLLASAMDPDDRHAIQRFLLLI
jgi:Ser/Thr protein kinase RdoA (MazF antagonist)